jgi:glucosamine-6-phosphate deaminase
MTGEGSRVLRYGDLSVIVHEDHASLAAAAASQAAQVISEEVSAASRAAVILASANSQLQFLSALKTWELPWEQVTIMHMDEYLGLDADHPASFRRFLRDQLIAHLTPMGPRAFYGIRGEVADATAEVARYECLLRRESPCLCVLGIGENGHLAFNDPPANPWNVRLLHEVTLDLECRMQQVGEGHFPDVDAVPRRALTLTISALLATPVIIGVVPERRKAQAVARALEGPIGPSCPASYLRQAGNATLHLDTESASLLTMDM